MNNIPNENRVREKEKAQRRTFVNVCMCGVPETSLLSGVIVEIHLVQLTTLQGDFFSSERHP